MRTALNSAIVPCLGNFQTEVHLLQVRFELVTKRLDLEMTSKALYCEIYCTYLIANLDSLPWQQGGYCKSGMRIRNACILLSQYHVSHAGIQT